MYQVVEKLISNNRSRKPLDPQGIVIHSTATPGATAQNEYNYFNSQYRGASAHYFVDWQIVIRTIPENEQAWHAGSVANSRYLSIETCEPYGTGRPKFEEVWNRTVWLAADICVRYGLTTNNIFSHKQISETYQQTNHTDPIGYLNQYGRSWESLMKAIVDEIRRMKSEGSGEGQFVEYMILVGRGPDERAAGYLADYLRAPVLYLDDAKEEYLTAASNIYVVGGNEKPVERAILLSGANRYETCQKVLDFIKAGRS